MTDINAILELPNLQDIIRRFERKFVKGGPDECWQWNGAVMARGYGKVGLNHEFWGAHRLAYLFYKGPIPNAGKFVGSTVCRHTCDNTGCVNPKHIELGTQVDNMGDMRNRGRMPLGLQRKSAKLTDEQVLAIRADTRLHRVIAEEYNVQRRQISRIKDGTRRQHL